MNDSLLKIEDLRVDLMTVRGIVYGVQGVNLDIKKGEIHGIVGESGCGKSLTVKSIMRLHDEKRTRYTGRILFENEEQDILKLGNKQMQSLRGQDITMIFQDPMNALNPIMKIGDQVVEAIRNKKKMSKSEAKQKVYELFEKVNIIPVEKRYSQYPFEMSGGLLQRVMIAMALSCEPKLLIADEPTTALDVTIQAQILKLLKELQKELETSIIIVTHNLGVVAEVCDRVSVMYAGRVVETGTVMEIFDNPKHPYLKALLDSNPKTGHNKERMATIPGMPPKLYAPVKGCAYADRCPYAKDICNKIVPEKTVLSNGHEYSCHFALDA